MILITSFIDAWKRPFDYKGLTTRNNYWFYTLSVILIDLVLRILQGIFLNLSYLSTSGFDEYTFTSNFFLFIYQTFRIIDHTYSLGTLIVSPSIIVRRLRDAGKQWQWIFLFLVPMVGWIWLIVLYCQPTKRN